MSEHYQLIAPYQESPCESCAYTVSQGSLLNDIWDHPGTQDSTRPSKVHNCESRNHFGQRTGYKLDLIQCINLEGCKSFRGDHRRTSHWVCRNCRPMKTSSCPWSTAQTDVADTACESLSHWDRAEPTTLKVVPCTYNSENDPHTHWYCPTCFSAKDMASCLQVSLRYQWEGECKHCFETTTVKAFRCCSSVEDLPVHLHSTCTSCRKSQVTLCPDQRRVWLPTAYFTVAELRNLLFKYGKGPR